jgi:hypothetical protein
VTAAMPVAVARAASPSSAAMLLEHGDGRMESANTGIGSSFLKRRSAVSRLS